MDTVASWIWNPFLSLIYLEIGLLFLFMTKGAAWRYSWSIFREIWNEKPNVVNGRQISHKKAFLAALSATVGVGNLAGVGTAIHLGGPGALFWMWMSALCGMSFRMCSTYLAVQYGPTDSKSRLFATPMSYMEAVLPQPWRQLSVVLAGLVLCKGLFTANLIQSNSVAHAITNHLGLSNFIVATILAICVGLVVIGGMQVIIDFSSAVAPWMLLVYVGSGLWILLSDPLRTLQSLGMVVHYAFNSYSVGGGIAGYTVLRSLQFGVSRGIFSHSSGIGLAPFLQGANNDHPARGAYMAALVPFVDTIIICTITGLVILSTDLWPAFTGAYLAVSVFQANLGETGRTLVIIALMVFAFTTIISWAYYSERCFEFLGGKNFVAYRWFFTGVSFCGPFFPVAFIWSVGDVLIALLLIAHLMPLTYIVIRKQEVLRQKLAPLSKPMT
ncbi:MAG: amino acid carrier protein [Magnetococcus sp. DMHC-6]